MTTTEEDTFCGTHPNFIGLLSNLWVLLDKVFVRVFTSRGSADGVVFHLGRSCADDFSEIFVLCDNGYGIGGLKLLRSFYECVVTMAYIAMNPDKAEDFLGYHAIHEHKELNCLKEFLEYAPPEQRRDITTIFSEEDIKYVEKKFQETKGRYQEPLCRKCGTSRTRLQWTELDIPTMAKKVGMGAFYFTCNYLPLLYGHSTFSAIRKQLAEKKNPGDAIRDPSAQHKAVNLALQGAHSLILQTIEIQNTFFGLALDNECSARLHDFTTFWSDLPVPMRID